MRIIPAIDRSRTIQEASFPMRVLRCLTSFRKWRRARAIDGAAAVLWNQAENDQERNLACSLMDVSGVIWKGI